MSKPTPGPWKVVQPDKSKVPMVWSEKGAICGPYYGTNISFEEARANALLIGAAKDLLAALKGLQKEELLHEHEGSPASRALAARRMRSAEAAIAKAEGRK